MWIITKPINAVFVVATIINNLIKASFFKAEIALMEVMYDDIPNQELDAFKDELINS